MIYCVPFAEVETDLTSKGFRRMGQTKESYLYADSTGQVIFVRQPNDHGDVPEILVNDAYDTAGVAVPKWDGLHWCD